MMVEYKKVKVESFKVREESDGQGECVKASRGEGDQMGKVILD